MNGVHDMGGMHGMGPVRPEREEPVFHHRWEARTFALVRAMGAFRRWNIDASRHQRELIAPAEYLRMSYYERWLVALLELLLRHGFASASELASGRADPQAPKLRPALMAEDVPLVISRGSPALRSTAHAPKFRPGQPVRARNFNPAGHTRLPRYVRGRLGGIEATRGVFVFPDTHAHLRGEHPQPLYSVRFAARELWGEGVVGSDAVYLDLWEDYLEPA